MPQRRLRPDRPHQHSQEPQQQQQHQHQHQQHQQQQQHREQRHHAAYQEQPEARHGEQQEGVGGRHGMGRHDASASRPEEATSLFNLARPASQTRLRQTGAPGGSEWPPAEHQEHQDRPHQHRHLQRLQAEKAAFSRELGLQPRQVEVWFQNRRARHRLRQAEGECEQLRRQCELLERENQQLQLLLLQSSEPAGPSASDAVAVTGGGTAAGAHPHDSVLSAAAGGRRHSDDDIPRDLLRVERAPISGGSSRPADTIILCPSCLSWPLGTPPLGVPPLGTQPGELAGEVGPGTVQVDSNQQRSSTQQDSSTAGSGHDFDLNLTL
ncbi:hypothetical protein CLOM_g6683 [Closterium sp. NIES-68]|nr:hypothetical protein CLOM_g6683 [Closterium sp. NIES-68]